VYLVHIRLSTFEIVLFITISNNSVRIGNCEFFQEQGVQASKGIVEENEDEFVKCMCTFLTVLGIFYFFSIQCSCFEVLYYTLAD